MPFDFLLTRHPSSTDIPHGDEKDSAKEAQKAKQPDEADGYNTSNKDDSFERDNNDGSGKDGDNGLPRSLGEEYIHDHGNSCLPFGLIVDSGRPGPR